MERLWEAGSSERALSMSSLFWRVSVSSSGGPEWSGTSAGRGSWRNFLFLPERSLSMARLRVRVISHAEGEPLSGEYSVERCQTWLKTSSETSSASS